MIEIPIKKFPEKVTQQFLDKCLLQREGYNRHGVLHDMEFLEYLRNSYQSFKCRDDFRMFNLFNTKRYFTEHDSISRKYLENFKTKYGFKDMTSYILEYTEGSFATMHMDNASELTLVTLIDLEEGTIGGDVIGIGGTWISKNKDDKVITQDQWSKIDKKDKIVALKSKPVVADLSINETISYGHNAEHGVSELRRGKRVVLIQWCYYNFTRAEKGIR